MKGWGFLPVFLVAEFSCLYVSRIAWQLYGLLALKIVRKLFVNRKERRCLTGGSGRRQEAASQFTLRKWRRELDRDRILDDVVAGLL